MQLTVCSRHAGHLQQKIREHFFSYCNSLFTISRNPYLETYCIQHFWWATKYTLIMQLTVCSRHAGHFQQKIGKLFFSYCNTLFTISTNAYLETFRIQ